MALGTLVLLPLAAFQNMDLHINMLGFGLVLLGFGGFNPLHRLKSLSLLMIDILILWTGVFERAWVPNLLRLSSGFTGFLSTANRAVTEPLAATSTPLLAVESCHQVMVLKRLQRSQQILLAYITNGPLEKKIRCNSACHYPENAGALKAQNKSFFFAIMEVTQPLRINTLGRLQ